jgi:hypothetical protein
MIFIFKNLFSGLLRENQGTNLAPPQVLCLEHSSPTPSSCPTCKSQQSCGFLTEAFPDLPLLPVLHQDLDFQHLPQTPVKSLFPVRL